MHLPFSPVRPTASALDPLLAYLQRNVGGALWTALAPLMLGGIVAPPMLLLPLASQPAQAQSARTLIIQRSLRLGDRGPDVLQLQQALSERGLLEIDIPRNAREGYFGPATKTALQAFQRSERDLQVDGILGEATFRRLFAVGLTPTQAYSIALMQAQLSELGYYSSSLDGQFGPATEQALRDLRDEAFVTLDPRAGGLENTFDVVSGYYNQQRQKQDLPHPDILEARVERQVPETSLWSYGNSWNPSAPPSQGAVNNTNTYQVIVPLDRSNQAGLTTLQRLIGSVTFKENRRGSYAQVGAYYGRNSAEDMVTYLRGQGFDARVIYE